MITTAKRLSLIEQKRQQWAKEREEMSGLYGLWGRPRNLDTIENRLSVYTKNNSLPPIEGKNEYEDPLQAEESETSGYLSDSPKHLKDRESDQEHHCIKQSNEELNNELSQQQQYWNEVNGTDQENFWTKKKMYKNHKNENWSHQNADSINCQRFYQTNRNFWHGTPDSLSSDDGSRLRWGDRGVGIGHFWEPVVNHPNCRLPLVADPYRQTPKWVEKGLKKANGNKADILIIHHPDDAHYNSLQKNYLLGQNAPIPLEVIEEREKKRQKALEHQNAIKKQLEERELKRRQEKENRVREEKLEEERIKKEQEIERLRYEDEQKKMKEKEEIEKKKEEVMREAIEMAEKRAKEEKRLNKRHLMNNMNHKTLLESEKKLERIMEPLERSISYKKQNIKTPRYKKTEILTFEGENQSRKDQNGKTLKDSSSQFEDIQLAQNFQLLNVNGLPVEGGLALMLDSPPTDNNGFLLPPDGVQLALLMSPRTVTTANRLVPTTPMISSCVNIRERILTPSKYRVAKRLLFSPSNKATQTEYSFCWNNISAAVGKEKKQSRKYGTNSGSSGTSQKCSNERHHKHIRCFLSSKYRLKAFSSKNLEDRPKWGINRPSVQYKKQSEKDPYYQKKKKERLKKAEIEVFGKVETKEKEMSSEIRLLECQSDEDEKQDQTKENIVLQNGFRMNSSLSSPVFVPIRNKLSDWEKEKKLDMDSDQSRRSNDSEQFESAGNEDANEDEEKAGSVGFFTQTQLEAIKQIASLREGLRKLQKDYSNSRSTTPFSDRSIGK